MRLYYLSVKPSRNRDRFDCFKMILILLMVYNSLPIERTATA
jgi:hypothetical protein